MKKSEILIFAETLLPKIDTFTDEVAVFSNKQLRSAKRYYFNLTESKDGLDSRIDIDIKTGLYYFEAKLGSYYSNWINSNAYIPEEDRCSEFLKHFTTIWNSKKRSGGKPAIIKNRFQEQFQLIKNNDWVPFYLGKYKGKLKNRALQHVFPQGSTYSLRLKDLSIILNEIEFRMCFVDLEFMNDYILYNQIDLVEKKVRDIRKPIVGKQ